MVGHYKNYFGTDTTKDNFWSAKSRQNEFFFGSCNALYKVLFHFLCLKDITELK